MIHENIKRGDNSLHVSVNFTPVSAHRSGSPRELNGTRVEVPVILDMGGKHCHPNVQHVPPVPVPPPTTVTVPTRPAVPLMPLKQACNGLTVHALVNGVPIYFTVATASGSSPINAL